MIDTNAPPSRGSTSRIVQVGSVITKLVVSPSSSVKSASSLLMLIRPLRPAYWASAVPRCRRRWGW